MGKVGKMLPILLLLVLLVALPAAAQKPDFGPHVIVDGVAWGTKAVTPLPVNEHNHHSFDNLYVFPPETAHPDQLLVGDSAPGDTDFNGGRWDTHTVIWKVTPTLLTSDAEIFAHEELGHLEIRDGSFQGGPPDYFECPLLPVLE